MKLRTWAAFAALVIASTPTRAQIPPGTWQPAPGAVPFYACGGPGQVRCLPPDGIKYRYIPTEQDRAEVSDCLANATPDTRVIDCTLPVTLRITNAYQHEAAHPPSGHPSQMAVMADSAAAICGLPLDASNAPVSAEARPCVDRELRKIAVAVALGITQYALSLQ